MERTLFKQNDAHKDQLGRQISNLHSVTSQIRDHLKREEVLFDDISAMYQKNNNMVDSTTKKVADLLQSSAGKTLYYLLAAVLLLLLLLYMLK